MHVTRIKIRIEHLILDDWIEMQQEKHRRGEQQEEAELHRRHAPGRNVHAAQRPVDSPHRWGGRRHRLDRGLPNPPPVSYAHSDPAEAARSAARLAATYSS